jgi:DNA (cytosine-5)-methyltransferase 1
MRYLSLFSGIGGFELGMQRACRAAADRARETSSPEPSPVACIGYSEIDRHAVQIYQKHYPEHNNYGDITKINPKELPDFDLLVGGFPCQPFSIAGRRKGFEDTRGTLFFDIARILGEKRPRLFLLENVKGLLSHDGGRTFKTVVSTLARLGYDIQWQVLNSAHFGVPQNRERVFIVGHLGDAPRPEVFPLAGTDRGDTVAAAALPEIKSAQSVRIREASRKGYAEAHVGQCINLAFPNSKTRTGRVTNAAPTLDTGMHLHTLAPAMHLRRLTPTECERLQGFPDGWTAGISDTQRYKCLGNAVTVSVIEAIARKLLFPISSIS